jgi:tRNA U54 and U55 pseudouridine synthase Pus10
MTRPRKVSDIRAEMIDEHHFRIKITTQAGT